MELSGAALVHDYFVQDGGAERVAIELSQLLPRAAIYTSFFDAAIFGERIEPARVHAWALNGRFNAQRFRSLLPLYPAYFSALDLRAFELVVSSSSAFAKAVRTSRRALHLAYIHAPMRFAWQYGQYTRRLQPRSRRARRRPRCSVRRCARGTGARRSGPTC